MADHANPRTTSASKKQSRDSDYDSDDSTSFRNSRKLTKSRKFSPSHGEIVVAESVVQVPQTPPKKTAHFANETNQEPDTDLPQQLEAGESEDDVEDIDEVIESTPAVTAVLSASHLDGLVSSGYIDALRKGYWHFIERIFNVEQPKRKGLENIGLEACQDVGWHANLSCPRSCGR
jgi:hypothetical protein